MLMLINLLAFALLVLHKNYRFVEYLISPEEVVLKSMLTIFWSKTLDIILISPDLNPISAEFFQPYEKMARLIRNLT